MSRENLFKTFAKTVATAGTQERLSSTDLFVSECEVHVLLANTGASMHLGGSDAAAGVGRPIAKGTSFCISNLRDIDGRINIKNVWIDADTSGDICIVSYIQRNQDV